MKDITDTVNDVCMVTVVWDITITFALLHVPYKSELIITYRHQSMSKLKSKGTVLYLTQSQ